MGQAQINVRTRACSGTFIARTKQVALTHNVRGKELMKWANSNQFANCSVFVSMSAKRKNLNILEKLRLIKESKVKEIWLVSLDEWVDEEWQTMRNTCTVHL